ncbi:MAG: hypothetical protein ACPGQS_04210 [Bradymonadia bacterium]
MGHIELTFCGDWKKLPDLNTRFKVSFAKRDGELTQDILFVGERAQCLDADDIRKIRGHRAVIRAELAFESEPPFRPAIEALQLARDLFECGGTGLFVETATKVFTPRTLGEITTDEPRLLFHFLVEVFGNKEAIMTSGMTAFGLPDVRVPYTLDMVGPAQSAAFSLAARMVCDEFVPMEGSPFRASESAPLYEMARDTNSSSDNPLGFWSLSLSNASA